MNLHLSARLFLTIVFLVPFSTPVVMAWDCRYEIQSRNAAGAGSPASAAAIHDDCYPEPEPPFPPPPPPPPPIALDDMFTQINYGYTVRSGDYNGDGYKDLYIKRNNGNANNGVVYEAVATQSAAGYFTVLGNSHSVLSVGRQWPVLSVEVRSYDMNGDGHVDAAIPFLDQVHGFRYAQTFISSGRDYSRNAALVSTHDAAAQKFERDLLLSAGNPDYWDDAKEPDEEGYRVQLVLQAQICYGWFCYYDTAAYTLGTIKKSDLGLSKSATVYGTYSKVGGASGSSVKNSYPVAKVLDNTANALISDPQVSSYIGTASQKQTAMNYFGINNNVSGDTLYCVWFCGWAVYFGYNSYTYLRWYDIWTPITIEGDFDDANYSREAFEFVQGELELDEILKRSPNAQTAPARDAVRRMVEIIFGVGGDSRPIDTNGPYWEGEILRDGAQAAKKILQRLKWKWLCRSAEDPQDCISAIEDDVLGDPSEADIEAGTVGGIWLPDQWDEDDENFARNFPLLAAIVIQASQPGRWQCSYRKRNISQSLIYYGITSTVASGNCQDAVIKRSRAYDGTKRFKRKGSWRQSELDMQTNLGRTIIGTQLVARQIIRGREQQLIDEILDQKPWMNYRDGLDAPSTFNRIRSVATRNPLGCAYWKASNATFVLFSPVGPFTGIDYLNKAPIVGCSEE